MSTPVVAVIVGSNRHDSLNAQLAHALTQMAENRLTFRFIAIDELPIFNQDLEATPPASVVRFKADIAAADGLLFVTPEHNRSIPAVLKNAIDWGSRPSEPERLGPEDRRCRRRFTRLARRGGRADPPPPDPVDARRTGDGRRGLYHAQA